MTRLLEQAQTPTASRSASATACRRFIDIELSDSRATDKWRTVNSGFRPFRSGAVTTGAGSFFFFTGYPCPRDTALQSQRPGGHPFHRIVAKRCAAQIFASSHCGAGVTPARRHGWPALRPREKDAPRGFFDSLPGAGVTPARWHGWPVLRNRMPVGSSIA